MKRKIKYISPLIFLFLIIILFVQVNSVHALDFTPQVIHDIGFGKANTKMAITGDSIGQLIKAIYTYALGIVGILATIVMMYGGVLYITAAGNASKMDNAKQWIFSSLTGLVLALSSYTLLYMVNPNLLTMTAIDPIKPDPPPADGCCGISSYYYTMNSVDCAAADGSFRPGMFANSNRSACISSDADTTSGCCQYHGTKNGEFDHIQTWCDDVDNMSTCLPTTTDLASPRPGDSCSFTLCN